MQHLEVSGAVRYIYIYIYIYVVRQLRFNFFYKEDWQDLYVIIIHSYKNGDKTDPSNYRRMPY